MMGKRVMLCVDGQSVRNPAMVGLAGEPLDSFPWLACATDAQQCRQGARDFSGIEEAWIVSCDDMEPINVAAAVKHDDPCKKVYVVSCGQNGSMASRAANAGIDGLWSESQFLRRFAQVKQSCGLSVGQGFGGDAAAHCEAMARCVGDSRAVPGDCAPASGLGATAQQTASAWAAGASSALQALQAPRAGQEPQACQGPQATQANRPSGLSLTPPTIAPPATAASGTHSPAASPDALSQTAIAPARGAALAPAGKKATVIAVASGSGGCGKSTVAALLALLSARCGLATVAIDADLQFGDLHYLLGAGEPLRIEEAIEEPSRLARLHEAAQQGKPALLAACRRVEMADAAQHALPAILAQAARFGDVMVVNTGALWSDVHAATFDAADATAFLMDCRPSSLRATTHAVELCARLGVATTGFTFVVNRHERQSLLSAVDVSCSLRGAHAVEFPDGGRDVDELLGAGYAEELIASGNPLVGAVSDFLSGVLPSERGNAVSRMAPQASRRRRPLFGRRR